MAPIELEEPVNHEDFYFVCEVPAYPGKDLSNSSLPVVEDEVKPFSNDYNFDYVFFDWKGTLCKKSGKGKDERVRHRLHEMHKCLFSVLKDEVPSFDVLYDAFGAANLEMAQEFGDGRYSTEEVARRTLELLEITIDEFSFKLVLSAFFSGFEDRSTPNLKMEFTTGPFDEDEENALKRSVSCPVLVPANQPTLYDGAMEVLNEITSRGIRVGLIRNSKCPEEMMREILTQCGVNHFMSSVVMAGEQGYQKPDKEVFEAALTNASLWKVQEKAPMRILFIGNETPLDIVGANNMGWTSVLIRNTEDSSNSLADFEIDMLEELLEIIGIDD